MKYIFVGQNILGGLTLKGLLKQDIEPELVITREPNDYPNLVAITARKSGLTCRMTSDINNEPSVRKAISSSGSDLIFCCSWGDKIKQPLREVPSLAWVNFHPSFLPAYRGPRPIEWQLINGERKGGCTAHFMSDRFDAGNIIDQKKVEIRFADNGQTMRLKLGRLMGELAPEVFKLLSNRPDYRGRPQDPEKASYAPPREQVREIVWNKTAVEIYNLIRGLSPFPCAYYKNERIKLKIAGSEITAVESGPYWTGRARRARNGRLMIGASDYFLNIQKIRRNSGLEQLRPAEIPDIIEKINCFKGKNQ